MPNKDKSTNAIAMLKEDHERVKDLFDRFEETNGSATKAKIVSEALTELRSTPPLKKNYSTRP